MHAYANYIYFQKFSNSTPYFLRFSFFFFLSCAFEGFNYQNLELYGYNLNDFLDEKHLYLEVAEEEDKGGQKK